MHIGGRFSLSAGTGTLFVVATPIGNLGDLSTRAVATLRAADVILAEDTRVSRTLLAHYGINATLRSYHDHNERQMAEAALEMLLGGRNLALISDAGTPVVSDPGLQLVALAQSRSIPVRTIPGPSSVTAAIAVCGLAADRFAFEGFLPPRAGARRRRLEALADDPRLLVFLESPHRLMDCLDDLVAVLGGERAAFIGRELTKLHESHYSAPLAGLLAHFGAHPGEVRGEFVLCIGGAPEAAGAAAGASTDRVLAVLGAALPPGQAARLAAEITGEPRNALYRRLQGNDALDGADDGDSLPS